MIFLYLMVCSIQKEIIALLCWGFKELWAFKMRYHLNNCHFMYVTNLISVSTVNRYYNYYGNWVRSSE